MDAGTSFAVFGTICFDEQIFLNGTGYGSPRVWIEGDQIELGRDPDGFNFSIQPWLLLVPKQYADAVWDFFALWLLRQEKEKSPEAHRRIYRELMDFLYTRINNGELDVR